MPSVAADEPLDVCLRIIEERAYARAKQLIAQAKTMDDLPDDPMIDLVQEIEFEIAKEVKERRGAKRVDANFASQGSGI